MPASLPPFRRPALTGALSLVAIAMLGAIAARADAPAGRFAVVMPVAQGIPHPAPMPAPGFADLTPGQQCRRAIRAAERAAAIPDQLMAAIGRVESGRREADGTVNPWPWSINAEGTDHVYETKAQAIAAVRSLQAHGMRSIDVGCMQINLLHHPNAFASLEQAFDPVANAEYAARFLVQLHAQTGTWPTATAWYHSATPEIGADYQRKVMAVWPAEKQQHQGETARTELASAWGATMPVPPGGPGLPAVSGYMLPRRGAMGHVIAQAPGTAGRALSAYRALPIAIRTQVAARPVPQPPLLREVRNGD